MYPLSKDAFAPRNQWYIAAWSREITREPMERWILNEPVAFYRTQDGKAVALDGRCPHRHFPLGKSRVVGDNIECGYHGITFDQHGNCVRVPSQTDIPKNCRVKSYPLVEQWQWLWIWMGDPALADPALIPDHKALGLTDPDYEVVGGSYHAVPGRYMLMHDNLFDLTHFAYLHQTSIGSGDFDKAEEIRDQGENWISSGREFKDIACPQLFSGIFGYSGRVDRLFGMKLHMPCLHAGYDEFYAVGPDGGQTRKFLGALKVYHAITPATHKSAHYFFAFGRSFKKDDAAFGDALLSNLRTVIDEDMSATREIEAMFEGLDRTPHDMWIKADVTCAQGRRLFETMIAKEKIGEMGVEPADAPAE